MVIVIGVAVVVSGCAQIGYFVQAAHGQFSLLSDAKPIEDWLASPNTEDKLKHKLSKVQEIHRFAVRELGLPDNGSYRTYTDLKRPYVMWNVVATREFSLKPMQWCFPIAGCVNYRGYYNLQDAHAYAAQLRAEGYDVDVSGVPAYSTLGWFRDPVLSSFIRYPDAELARLIFHELAHQVAYVPGDSSFNESFAVAVEEAGIERWVTAQGDDKLRASYAAYVGRKREFLALLLKHRKNLERLYASDESDAQKREQKRLIFTRLQEDYQALKTSWGGYAGYDRWFAEPLSNAHLSAIATYHDNVPSFRALLAREKSLPKFYAAVQRLAELGEEERKGRLSAYLQNTNLPANAALVTNP